MKQGVGRSVGVALNALVLVAVGSMVAGSASAAAGGTSGLRTYASGSGLAKAGSIAGYDFKAAVNQGSATFKVPAVSCTGSDLKGIGLGLGVEDVVGTPTSLGTVFVACVSGAPFYQLSATANGVKGTGDADNVGAGDMITVSYKITGSNLTVTTKDSKTTGTVTASGSATPADSHLTFGSFPLFAAGSDDPLPVPDFGQAALSKVTVNSKAAKGGKKITGKGIRTGVYLKGAFALTYR